MTTRKTTYKNTGTQVWFKSNKANGFAFLSNFWPFVSDAAKSAVEADLRSEGSFVARGRAWGSVEHFFQAVKYMGYNDEAAKEIADAEDALGALRVNRKWKATHPVDMNAWHLRRDQVMEEALLAKFSQNAGLGQALVATGERRLSEVPGRSAGYWDFKGEDALGKALMRVRTSLLASGQFKPCTDPPQDVKGRVSKERIARVRAERAAKKRAAARDY